MTEAEIRNDERRKIIADLEWFKPFYRTSSGAFELAIAICAQRPLPEPPDTQKWWHGFSWDAFTPDPKVTYHVTFGHYDAKGNFHPAPPKPPKDWRDVPVTAGMLIQVVDLMESGRTGLARSGLEKLCRAKVGDRP